MGELTTAIWDFGGVIAAFYQSITNDKLSRRTNPKISPDEVVAILYGGTVGGREYNAGIAEPYNLGKIDSIEMYRRAKEAMGLKMGIEAFAEAWMNIFTLNEPIIEFIKELAERGIPQAVLSSTNPLHWARMDAMAELTDLLGPKNIVCTFHPDIGHKKPTGELWAATFARTGYNTNQCIYVDDVQRYTDAASAYGLGAVVHADINSPDAQIRQRNAEQCIREVSKLLNL